jgi:hypothetical protein
VSLTLAEYDQALARQLSTGYGVDYTSSSSASAVNTAAGKPRSTKFIDKDTVVQLGIYL